MRKKLAIYATYIGVAGLSLFGMSHFAMADSWVSGVWTVDNIGDTPNFTRNGVGGTYEAYFSNSSGYSCHVGGGLSDGVSFNVDNGTCSSVLLLLSNEKIQITDGSNVGYFIASSTVGYWGGVDSSAVVTRFISLDPVGVVSMVSTTSFELNLNQNDYVSGEYVQFSFSQPSFIPCANSGAIYDAIVTCTGSSSPSAPFSFSSLPQTLLVGDNTYYATTSFPSIGNWVLTATIKKPVAFGFWSIDLISSSTSFVVSTSSPMDLVMNNLLVASKNYASSTASGIAGTLASTTAQLQSVCNVLYGFDPSACLTLLIWPGATEVGVDMGVIENTPPWGYFYRFYTILSDTSLGTTSNYLPSISIQMPSVLGYHNSTGGTTVDFNPWNLFGTSSLIGSFVSSSSTGSRTLRQIAEPYWDTLWILVLLGAIIGRVTGVYSHIGGGFGKHGSLSDTSSSDDSYRLKEYLYKNRRH